MPSGSSLILSIIHQGCRSAAARDTAEGAGPRVESPACSGRWAGAQDRRSADSGAVSHDAVVPELDRFVHAAQGRVTVGCRRCRRGSPLWTGGAPGRLAPSNFVPTNPDGAATTVREPPPTL